MANSVALSRMKFFGGDGLALAFGKVYTYTAGTSIPKPTYTDSTAATPNPNPMILDINGEATMYWDGMYKVWPKTAGDVTVPGWPVDNIAASDLRTALEAGTIPIPASAITVADTANKIAAANVEAALAEIVEMAYALNPLMDQFNPPALNTGDYTAAIQACFDAAAVSGAAVTMTPRLEGYRISDNVNLPYTAAGLDMRGAQIWYAGPKDRTALELGTSGVTASRRRYLNLWVMADQFSGAPAVTWPGANIVGGSTVPAVFIGVKVWNASMCEISTKYISGFTRGFQAEANFNGWAYNNVYLGTHENNQQALVLTTSVGTNGFTNENNFYGGAMEQRSSTNALGDAYGVVFTWDHLAAYRGQNNNKFWGTCFELGQPGGTNRIPVWHDGAGGTNRFYECRHEANTGVFAICDSVNAQNNLYLLAYTGPSPVSGSVTQTGGALFNYVKPVEPANRADLTWFSGEIASYVSGRIANVPYISGPFHWVQNSTTIAKFPTASANYDIGYENGVEYVRCVLSSQGVGVFVKTDKCKQFHVALDCIAGFPGRLTVQCFSAAGVVLDSTGPNTPYARFTSSSNTSGYGGGYQTSLDNFLAGGIDFHDDVKYARIMFVGGTAVLKIISFSITAIGQGANNPLQVYAGPGVLDDPMQKLSSAKPDTAGEHGRYSIGNVVSNSASAAAVAAGWQCSTAGRLAKAWAITTAYVVGQVRANGVNVYVCKTAGTSAGAGGPVGTGTGIVDNTVVWDFLSPKAVFVTQAVLT